MLWTWFLTVATSIRSRLAISLFERPLRAVSTLPLPAPRTR